MDNLLYLDSTQFLLFFLNDIVLKENVTTEEGDFPIMKCEK